MKQFGIWAAAMGIAALLILAPARAQDTAVFFRVVSPTTTVITAFSPNGTLVWSNAVAIGNNGRIQRATTLMGPSNWTDYVGHTVTGKVMALRLFDPNPPSGMVLIPAGINSVVDPVYGAYSLTVSSFYMDKYEVTKALWDEVRNWNGGNGYGYDNAGSGKATNHPVYSVSWYDVVKWCNARSQKDGRVPVYYTDAAMTQVYKTGQVGEPYVKTAASGYRLPTEVQWEYAARGGVASRQFPWGGDTIDHGKANYMGRPSYYDYDTGYAGYDTRYSTTGFPYTSPVGSFEAGKNAYGLYDMAGNVWEWCYDWHPSWMGSARVFRGGSWSGGAYDCRVGRRGGSYPDNPLNDVGFRAALPPGQSYDTTPPADVSDFSATAGDGQIMLSWQNPGDGDFAGVRIHRQTGDYPAGVNDGATVYRGIGTSVVDTGLTNGTTYYYKAFSYDGVPNYSSGATATAAPQAVPILADMVFVQGGTLSVTSFYMGKYEVTLGEWQAVRTWAVTNGYGFSVGGGAADNYPVIDVNWYDCVKWCNARSQKEGRTPVYSVGGVVYTNGLDNSVVVNASVNGYSLPTEAQWEYAARGGLQSHGYAYSGGNDVNAVAWYSDNSSGGSKVVGTKAANELGLFDMSGNVCEWCYDWYPGFEGSYRVIRGGSWVSYAYDCRSGLRSPLPPGAAYSNVGFRAVLPPGQ